jgi:hypothetical protein
MQYDCPNCGALEGETHRASCSLAGLPVKICYEPFSYEPASAWLKANKHKLRLAYEGRYLMLNAEDFTFAAADTAKATHEAYVRRYGPTPAVGRHFLCVQM